MYGVLVCSGELAVVYGKLLWIRDNGEYAEAELAYDGFDGKTNRPEPCRTTLIFRNQQERADWKTPVPYKTLFLSQHFNPGDWIMATVRFIDLERRSANAYTVKPEGVFVISPDDMNIGGSAILGRFISMSHKDAKNGESPEIALQIGIKETDNANRVQERRIMAFGNVEKFPPDVMAKIKAKQNGSVMLLISADVPFEKDYVDWYEVRDIQYAGTRRNHA